ncbi:hypothetical protein DE146DRAFT_756667 [Phaeosphaeria sp. MPI-PUGE-AT-0046c]|nr:hypothetical protein DE146DRAFT_756667 [Phaeosphaeria sp. MPI-PUGE-AT-0046c]
MQRSLAASSIACAQLLDQLSLLLQDPERAQLSALQQSEAEDQSARFQVWAGNLGAFQRLPATASLDHRLRESPRIATQIYELLEELKTSTEDVRGIVLGERPNRRSEPDDETDDDSINRDDFLEHDSTDSYNKEEEGEEEDELPDLSEAEEIFESIKDTIASLFRLAVMIRKSTPRDRYARALGGHNPFIEDFDVAHVGHKFEKLNTESNKWLRNRLGKAITQRRQYLCYARDHRYKLGKEPAELWKPIADGPKANLQLPVDLSASQAGRTNTSRPTTTLADTTASTLFLQEATHGDRDFQDDQSQTSFAFSAPDEDDGSRMKLPRLSEVAKGQSSFECPFCWTMQTFRKEKAWKKHALSDLKPYVCTFEDCDMKMFPDRKMWFEHEMKLHRAKWQCHFCGQSSFQSAKAFCEHVRSSHGTDGGQDQLDALAEASKQPLTQFTASDCPFCYKWDDDLRKSNPDIPQSDRVCVNAIDLRRHIGLHMQDLALFAVPRGYLEEGEGDAASKASARAAGVGKNSASIAVSDTKGSVESYESAVDLTTYRNPVDPMHCAESIEAAMRLPGTAFEEALITILPALNENELHGLHSRVQVSSRIASSPHRLFANIAHLVDCGQGEAQKTWFQTWNTYSQTSRMWWNVACSLLTSDPRFHTRLKDVKPHIEKCIREAFEEGEYPVSFRDILRRVAVLGRPDLETYTSEEEIMNDINLLRSKSASAFEIVIALFTRSNRYLRRFVRLERKKYPESSIFPSSDISLGEGSGFKFDDDDDVFLPYILGHLFAGATDPVARDVNYLYAAFQAYGPQSFPADDKDVSNSEDWQSLIYQVLNLHWNKSHLRAVKSMFEDEYSATIESFIESLYDPTGTDKMFIPLLMALMNVDTGEDVIDFPDVSKSTVETGNEFSTQQMPVMGVPSQRGGDSIDQIVVVDPPQRQVSRQGKFSFSQIVSTMIVLRRISGQRKNLSLQRILEAIPGYEQTPGTDAWIGRLLEYPLFQDCTAFFGSIKPFITLRAYQAGETILVKSEAATWAGWLIAGRTTYVASYNPNDPTRHGRRKWTTSEYTMTFGLIGTLLDLPSLSHHVAETACVVAQIRKDDFKRLVREHKEVEQHLTSEEFGTSFKIARECLRIEVAFGRPWWHVFDPWSSQSIDLATATSKILQDADDPSVITSLVRKIGGDIYTPLDLVLTNKNIEAAKLLLESGAKVHYTTIKVALNNDDADFVELLLTRPGGAEAANELLRSGDTGYVPKLQKMLKEMQGSVPLVTASSLQANMEPDLQTSAPERKELDQSSIESSGKNTEDVLHEPRSSDDDEDRDALAAGSQDSAHDQPGEVGATSDELQNSSISDRVPEKKNFWASPMGSIRHRWGAAVMIGTADKGKEPESPKISSELDQSKEGADDRSQIDGIDSSASSGLKHRQENDSLGEHSSGVKSAIAIGGDNSSPLLRMQHTDDQRRADTISEKLRPSSPPLQWSSESTAPFSHAEFWAALNAYNEQECTSDDCIEKVMKLSEMLSADRTMTVAYLNSGYSRNDSNQAPLEFCIKRNQQGLVTWLLLFGADPNIRTSDGRYPLDLTLPRAYDRSKMTKSLIDYGAIKVNDAFQGHLTNAMVLRHIQSLYGKDWFDLINEARESKESRSQVHQILETSPNPSTRANVQSESGKRALDVAVANNDVDTVLLLLEYGAESGNPDELADALARPSTYEAIVQLLQLNNVTEGESRTSSDNEEFGLLDTTNNGVEKEREEIEKIAQNDMETDEDVGKEELEVDKDGTGKGDNANFATPSTPDEKHKQSLMDEKVDGGGQSAD